MSKNDEPTRNELEEFKKKVKVIDGTADVSCKKREGKSWPLIKELPSWFNLNNYKEIYQLDLEGWINQLFLRIQTEGFFQPIVTTGIVSDFRLPEKKKDNDQKHLPPVHNITVFEAIRLVESIKRYIYFPSEIWAAPSLLKSSGSSAPNMIRWFNENINGKELTGETLLLEKSPTALDLGIINVDLSTPDNILIADFKRWLIKKRGGKKTSHKNFSKSVLRRWAINQVLPYIDLTYWAILSQVQIPHWLMGEALFPGDQEGDKVDRIRKTTEKNAKEIMSKEYLYGMVIQLAYETGKHLDVDTYLYNPAEVETKFKILVPVKE